jgi:hypothetical protein
MRTKKFSTGSKNYMSACVMGHKLHAAFFVHFSSHLASCNLNFIWDVVVKLVKHTFADFGNINYLEFTQTFNCHHACIVHLTSRCWVERTLV